MHDNKSNNKTIRLNNIKESYILSNPSKIYENKQNKYNHLIEKLEVLNPLNTLNRGYTIVRSNNKVISDINDIKVSDKLEIEFKNGRVISEVIEVGDNNE